MVEQFHGKEEVIGSTPIVSTTFISLYSLFRDFYSSGSYLVILLFILYI